MAVLLSDEPMGILLLSSFRCPKFPVFLDWAGRVDGGRSAKRHVARQAGTAAVDTTFAGAEQNTTIASSAKLLCTQPSNVSNDFACTGSLPACAGSLLQLVISIFDWLLDVRAKRDNDPRGRATWRHGGPFAIQ